MEAAEDARTAQGDDGSTAKTSIEVMERDIFKVRDKYYFICSDKEVFLLNENEEYSKKLSDEEINELDFIIVWLGNPVKTRFESNDKKAISALVKIVEDFSSMVKKEEFHGFAVASLVSHLRGFLYEHLVIEQTGFYTTIVLSGEQRGTGKNMKYA